MNAQMDAIIGKTAQALAKEQPEDLLGNFVSDCIFAQSKKYLRKHSVMMDTMVLNHKILCAALFQRDGTAWKIVEPKPYI